MANQIREALEHLRVWLRKPEHAYLFIALLGVVGFAIITPPLQGPDEHSHYVRVQYLANGYFIPVNAQTSGAHLPGSIDKVADRVFYDDDIRGDTNRKYDLNDSRASLKIPYNSAKHIQPVMISYSPVPYLPAIPFVAMANALNLSPIVSIYLARLALGVTCVLIFFLAIRLMPYKKYLLVAIGLIPMMLFQQAMITADSISYALLALFIAYVLYLRHNVGDTLQRNHWIYLGALCLLITVAKPLVFLFLPLVLLLIKKRYAFRIIASITALCAVLLVLWMAIITAAGKGVDVVVDTTPKEVNSVAQAHIVKEHPKRVARILWNSYMTQYGDDEVRGAIGIFGAADTIYPLWMYTAYVGILALFAGITSDKRIYLPKRWKLMTFGISALYFLAVNYALYTGYTPLNFNIVYGVQGRYFLPIIIASIVVFVGGLYVSKKEFDRFVPKLMGSMAILIVLALFITIQRYYLYTP